MDRCEMDRFEAAQYLTLHSAVSRIEIDPQVVGGTVRDGDVTYDVRLSLSASEATVAALPPSLARFEMARCEPSCACSDELDWCAHAVALTMALVRAAQANPSLLQTWCSSPTPAETAGEHWLSSLLQSVLVEDRARVRKTLAFCFHPDRRGGDDTLMRALDAAWQQLP